MRYISVGCSSVLTRYCLVYSIICNQPDSGPKSSANKNMTTSYDKNSNKDLKIIQADIYYYNIKST